MNFYSNKVKDLQPYVPGEQPKDSDIIKLNTNENPYPPSIKVMEAIKSANLDKLRLYPDPESSDLRKTYAEILNLEPDNIFVGNGSDEVLRYSIQNILYGKRECFNA